MLMTRSYARAKGFQSAFHLNVEDPNYAQIRLNYVQAVTAGQALLPISKSADWQLPENKNQKCTTCHMSSVNRPIVIRVQS